MGKITEALKKVRDERIARIQKKPALQYVARRMENTSIDEHVISFHDPSSLVGEQYKMLRTSIQTLKNTKNYKTFAVTSAINGEGKTVTSINLAICMAHDLDNKTILLVDADMRKGRVAKYLGLSGHAGLAEILKGEAEAEATFINPNIDNLSIMCAGKTPRNPAELLNSKRMFQLLAQLKARFDYIIIDTPPVMPLTDVCVIGPNIDGVILVVQAGRTQRDIVTQAQNRLVQSRANVVGCVMTGVEYHLPQYLYRYVHAYDEYAYKSS